MAVPASSIDHRRRPFVQRLPKASDSIRSGAASSIPTWLSRAPLASMYTGVEPGHTSAGPFDRSLLPGRGRLPILRGVGRP
jgi:hypothetical protein